MLLTIIYEVLKIVDIREESNMNLFSFIPMIISWMMTATLFVLIVIVLVELIKLLKLKNTAFKLKDTKTNEEANPKNDSL